MQPAERLFPETRAGGFTRLDGTIAFFTRIRSLLEPGMHVVDFGAGRGRGAVDDPVSYRRNLRVLKGHGIKVTGIDVDSAVLENPSLDHSLVISPAEQIPLPDASVDLILSDMTFEHISDPKQVAGEMSRILRPGGWICARTPNRWGYIGIGANLIPNRLHVPMLRYLQPHRRDIDVFPTAYRLNTRAALRRYFPPDRFEDCSYRHFGDPGYFGQSLLAWRLALAMYRFTPEVFAPMWFIFLHKKT